MGLWKTVVVSEVKPPLGLATLSASGTIMLSFLAQACPLLCSHLTRQLNQSVDPLILRLCTPETLHQNELLSFLNSLG